MPNASIALWLVETATKWCPMPFSPSSPISHSRAALALASVSCVVKVFEQMTNRVRRRIDLLQRIGELDAVDVRHAMQADALVAEAGQRLGRHHDAEVGAADADVDDVGEARAGEAEDAPLVHAGDELAHLGELRAHLRHDVLPVRLHRTVRTVAQRHVHGSAALRCC